MSYNPLDNIEAAKQLREKLILERQDIRDSLSYEYATSWCDNCPRREHEPQSYSELEFGISVAEVCCKEDEVWAEAHQSEDRHDQRITDLIKALNVYLNEGG